MIVRNIHYNNISYVIRLHLRFSQDFFNNATASILTRWKSLVRIQRRPFANRVVTRSCDQRILSRMTDHRSQQALLQAVGSVDGFPVSQAAPAASRAVSDVSIATVQETRWSDGLPSPRGIPPRSRPRSLRIITFAIAPGLRDVGRTRVAILPGARRVACLDAG